MGEEEKKLEAEKETAVANTEKPKEEAKAEDAKVCGEDDEKEKKEGGGDGEEEKKEGGSEEKKAEVLPPPPPVEIEMRVFMHCEGCARKVRRSLKGFEGVEEVTTDCRVHKVVVKGQKAAEDPMKVVERVQRKTGRKVELLTPLPPPKPEKKEQEKKEEEKPKVEEKKEEPQVIVAVLKVHMHCEACAQEIKKGILKMKGVQSAESDQKASQVTVKGVFASQKLVEYVYRRTGKQALVAKEEPADKKTEEEKGSVDGGGDTVQEKAGDAGGDKAESEKKEGAGEEKETKEREGATEDGVAAPSPKVVELMRNEFYQFYPRSGTGYAAGYVSGYAYPPQHAYPPQLFSDENPNACSVM